MIHTSYVPLEHPYQIIEYNAVLGIQIGTLIVTVERPRAGGRYGIETHSHPVVAYVNNRLRPDLKHPSSLAKAMPIEGVVWDKVELYQVTTVSREGEAIGWRDYMELCQKWRYGEQEGPLRDIDTAILDNYGRLKDWGINVMPPDQQPNGERLLTVEFEGILDGEKGSFVMGGGDMGIVAPMSDNIMVTANSVLRQTWYYIKMMEFFKIYNTRVRYVTQNLFLQQLVDELNRKIAQMPSDEMGHFHTYNDRNMAADRWSGLMAAEDGLRRDD